MLLSSRQAHMTELISSSVPMPMRAVILALRRMRDAAGKLHGSDFLVDWVEFEFMPLATPPAPDVGIG